MYGHCDAAVVCAAGGSFHVAFVSTEDSTATGFVYASHTGLWSAPIYSDLATPAEVSMRPAAFVGGALYFACTGGYVLRFDITRLALSIIQPPPPQLHEHEERLRLMPAEDGGLRFATLVGNTLHLHVLKPTSPATCGWVMESAIHLSLEPEHQQPPRLVGFDKTVNCIFIKIDTGVISIELRSLIATKVLVRAMATSADIHTIYPYTSFCPPILTP
jgi:hypothetical protein